MRYVLAFFVLVAAIGCSPQEPVAEEPQTEPTAAAPSASAPAPIGSGAATGLTPMTGTENVGGGGMGGVGQAAKDRARDVAGSASQRGWQPDGE
jgi:hypothetical protein